MRRPAVASDQAGKRRGQPVQPVPEPPSLPRRLEEVPPGGDLYTLKDIVHDWPDELAVKLLRVCRRAMHEQASLLLIEPVIRPGDQPSPGKFVDMLMLALTGRRERTLGEYRVLLEAAGLSIAGTTDTATDVVVIEARPLQVASHGIRHPPKGLKRLHLAPCEGGRASFQTRRAKATRHPAVVNPGTP